MDDQNTYIFVMAMGAFIKALGMMSENLQRSHSGNGMAYVAIDFEKLADEHGLYHNAILRMQRGE